MDTNTEKYSQTIRICRGPTCELSGCSKIQEKLKNKGFKLEEAGCMDNCAKGPNIKIDNQIITDVSQENVEQKIKHHQTTQHQRKIREELEKINDSLFSSPL